MKATRPQILAEARALFLEHGMEGLSMRKLAKGLGITPPALYRHYKNKEAIVADVFLEGVEVFSAYLMRALEGETPQERLRLTSEAFLRFGLEQPRHFEVFFLKRPHDIEPAAMARFEARQRAAFLLLLDRVRENLDAGALRPVGSARDIALILLASAQGMVAMHLTRQLESSDVDFAHTYRRTYQALIAGLSA